MKFFFYVIVGQSFIIRSILVDIALGTALKVKAYNVVHHNWLAPHVYITVHSMAYLELEHVDKIVICISE